MLVCRPFGASSSTSTTPRKVVCAWCGVVFAVEWCSLWCGAVPCMISVLLFFLFVWALIRLLVCFGTAFYFVCIYRLFGSLFGAISSTPTTSRRFVRVLVPRGVVRCGVVPVPYLLLVCLLAGLPPPLHPSLSPRTCWSRHPVFSPLTACWSRLPVLPPNFFGRRGFFFYRIPFFCLFPNPFPNRLLAGTTLPQC